MCGILGMFDPGGAGASRLKVMSDVLAHRGPDDEGAYADGAVGLGQRRLAIIDLDGGAQPMASEDGSLWITFNGEIYNYRELRAGLAARHRFATDSDTEVILHLYEEKGERCVEYLRGMFAFAIWDARRRRMFLARDHLGQKPLYYSLKGNRLTFASEVKALLADDPSLRELDVDALHQYLNLRIVVAPRSMFAGVRKLPPGHYLIFAKGEAVVRRYWQLDYEPKLRLSESDMIEALDEQVAEAVRYHMVSDVPVGAFLSGGLDSSLVVAAMSKVANAPVKTFSVGVPYGQFSELPAARQVAERYQTEHHEETVFPSLVRVLPELVYHLDEPSDPLSVCMYYIAAMARRQVKVVLGGDGGDELFGGYDRYYGHRYVDYYARLPRAVREHLVPRLLAAIPDGFWYKSASHQLRWLNQMSFAEGGERYAKSLTYFFFNDGLREALFGDRLRSSLARFEPGEAIHRYFDAANASDLVDRMLYADSMVRLPEHSVMILDRTAMAHGLEARSPFMDHKLAEFAARMPASLKIRGRSRRYIQTRLAERYLPPELLRRKKQGFASALPYLLADEFKLLFRAFLFDSHLVREGYLNGLTIRRLLNEHLSRRVDHGNRLWLLLNAEVWYRMAIGGWSHEMVREVLAGEERSLVQAR